MSYYTYTWGGNSWSGALQSRTFHPLQIKGHEIEKKNSSYEKCALHRYVNISGRTFTKIKARLLPLSCLSIQWRGWCSWMFWINLWNFSATFGCSTTSKTALSHLSPHTAVLLNLKFSAAASGHTWAQDRDLTHQSVSRVMSGAGAFPPCTLFILKASSCYIAMCPTAMSSLLAFSTAKYTFCHII